MNLFQKTTAVAGVAIAGAMASTSATAVNLSTEGIGELAVAPFYTTREGWSTLVNLTNTQNVPIVVKVRIRESQNSRDVLDFLVTLSAFDVFTGVITERDADGDGTTEPVFFSTDQAANPMDVGNTGQRSCTVPQRINDFPVSQGPLIEGPPEPLRREGFGISSDTGMIAEGLENDVDGGPTTVDRLREGHVEFIVMGYADRDDSGMDQPTILPNGAINVARAIEQHDCDRVEDAFRGFSNATGEAVINPETQERRILETARQFGEPINAIKFNFRLLNPTLGVETGLNATTWANFYTGGVTDPNNIGGQNEADQRVTPAMNAECQITVGDTRGDLDGQAFDVNNDNAVDQSLTGGPEQWRPAGQATTNLGLQSCNNLIASQSFPAFLEPSANNAYPTLANGWSDEFNVPTRIVGNPGVFSTADDGRRRGADAMNATIQRQSVVNEYSSEDALGVSTDWIVTFPFKHLNSDVSPDVPGSMSSMSGTSQQAGVTTGRPSSVLAGLNAPYPPFNQVFSGMAPMAQACDPVAFSFYDRAERTTTPMETDVDVSPAPPPVFEREELCFETNVVTFNGRSALGMTNLPVPNRVDVDTSGLNPNKAGWMFMELDNKTSGGASQTFLPAGVQTFENANGGGNNVDADLAGLPTIGFNLKLRNFGDVSRNFASSLDHSYFREAQNIAPNSTPLPLPEPMEP